METALTVLLWMTVGVFGAAILFTLCLIIAAIINDL